MVDNSMNNSGSQIYSKSIVGRESYQHLIDNLRRYRGEGFKSLLNKLYKKLYPDRDRFIFEITNWNYEKPFKVRMDSQRRYCNACNSKNAYYTVYNMKYLPNFGLRLCAKCLSPRDREVIQQYYWNDKRYERI